MNDFENACFLTLNPHTSPQNRHQAFVYLEQLKHSNTGWQLAIQVLSTLSNNSEKNEYLFFAQNLLCFQIENYWNRISNVDRDSIKRWILLFLTDLSSSVQPDIANKIASFLVSLCKHEYPDKQPSFFNDLISTCLQYNNKLNAEQDKISIEARFDMFFRVMNIVDEDILAFNSKRTNDEIVCVTKIKESMKIEGQISKLLDVQTQILSNFYSNKDQSLTVIKCLHTVSLFFGWIDISLIVDNEKLISLLFKFLYDTTYQISSTKCLRAVIRRRLEPIDRLQLIEKFSAIFTIATEIPIENDDSARAMSKLISEIGHCLIDCNANLDQSLHFDKIQRCVAIISNVIPLAFSFLSHKNWEVSIEVIDFVSKCVSVFIDDENNKILSIEVLSRLFTITINQLLKLPEQYGLSIGNCCGYGDNEKDDLADFESRQEFNKFRIKARNLFKIQIKSKNFGKMALQMFYEHMICIFKAYSIKNQQLQNERKLDVGELNDIESILYIIQLIGEDLRISRFKNLCSSTSKSLIKNYKICESNNIRSINIQNLRQSEVENIDKNSFEQVLMEMFASFIDLIIESDLLKFCSNCRQISLHFFCIISKYGPFYFNYRKQQQNQLFGHVLSSFFDCRGLQNPDSVVRLKSAYFFLKLIDQLSVCVQKHLSEFVSDIVDGIQRSLIAYLRRSTIDNIQLTSQDFLNMCEIVGVLIRPLYVGEQRNRLYLMKILDPLIQELVDLIECIKRNPSVNFDFNVSNLSDLCRGISYLAKYISINNTNDNDFSDKSNLNTSSPDNTNLIFCLIKCLDLILQGLELLSSDSKLLSSTMVFVHHLLPCLDHQLLNFLPRMFNLFLPNITMSNVEEFLQFIHRLISKYKIRLREIIEFQFLKIVSSIFSCFELDFLPHNSNIKDHNSNSVSHGETKFFDENPNRFQVELNSNVHKTSLSSLSKVQQIQEESLLENGFSIPSAAGSQTRSAWISLQKQFYLLVLHLMRNDLICVFTSSNNLKFFSLLIESVFFGCVADFNSDISINISCFEIVRRFVQSQKELQIEKYTSPDFACNFLTLSISKSIQVLYTNYFSPLDAAFNRLLREISQLYISFIEVFDQIKIQEVLKSSFLSSDLFKSVTKIEKDFNSAADFFNNFLSFLKAKI